jgi:hypothetical protein
MDENGEKQQNEINRLNEIIRNTTHRMYLKTKDFFPPMQLRRKTD